MNENFISTCLVPVRSNSNDLGIFRTNACLDARRKPETPFLVDHSLDSHCPCPTPYPSSMLISSYLNCILPVQSNSRRMSASSYLSSSSQASTRESLLPCLERRLSIEKPSLVFGLGRMWTNEQVGSQAPPERLASTGRSHCFEGRG